MASNILQFDPTRLITAINIVDNMLFYSDGVTEPKKIENILLPRDIDLYHYLI